MTETSAVSSGKRTATRLMKLQVREISLVDSGANGGAKVVLMKRAGTPGQQGDGSMADKTPSLEELAALVEKAGAENEVLKAANEKLTADLTALQKAQAEAKDGEIASLTKRLDDLAKSNGELTAALATVTAEREQGAYLLKAKDYGHLPVGQAEIAKALRSIDKIGGDEAASITAILKAADAAMADVLKVAPGLAVGAVDPASPQAQLDTLVQKAIAANPKLDEAHAYAAVLKTDAGKALYAETIEKRN